MLKNYQITKCFAFCTLACLLISGCSVSSDQSLSFETQKQMEYIENMRFDDFPETADHEESEYEQTNQPEDPPGTYSIDAYDNFTEANEKLQMNLLDFEIDGIVAYSKVYTCCVLQACEGIKDFESGGLVPTTITVIDEDNPSAPQNKEESKSDSPVKPISQTVILSDDEYEIKIIRRFIMSTSDNEETERKSYFSEKLGCNVDLLFEKHFGTNISWETAAALFEYNGAAYNINFPGAEFETIEDFEANAKEFI